ncbi:MAG TPA: M28 family peptidase [Nitrospira sp.]|nr:M28 family peptidase [Nitrospira sp.]
MGTLIGGLACGHSQAADSLDAPTSLSQAFQSISTDRMLADIRTLAGPEFYGRQTGTPYDLASAEFVQRRFLQLSVDETLGTESSVPQDRLSGRAWLQSTTVRYKEIGQGSLLQLIMATGSSPALIGSDYLPVLDSPSADIQASIVFVGYGISDPTGGIDEYAGMDVRNKVVLFLRGKPERYSKPISHADKARIAQAHGAIGLLTATGPILTAYEIRRGITGRPSAFYGLTEPEQTIPGAWISTALATSILNGHQPDTADVLSTLQQHINQSLEPQSRTTDATVAMRWTCTQRNGAMHNVISMLPGLDPVHGRETVVIGAHRDHFGQQGGLVFPGADDNASGTAVLLEVARVLASSPAGFQRSIALVSFSGEEQGLLGSTFYVAHPAVALPSTVAMLNVDHAGVGNGRFTVGVTGLEKSTAEEAGRKSGLADRLDLFGFFPGGDHVPFKEAGVPTITVVSGGLHPHFHQPSDRPDTVSPDILLAAARYVLALCWQLAHVP